MDDRVGRGERVLGLAEIGQVGHQGLLGRVPVGADVDVDHVMAVLAQVAHDPRSALAAAARDDDPHVRHLRDQYRLRDKPEARPPAGILDQGLSAAARTGSRPAA